MNEREEFFSAAETKGAALTVRVKGVASSAPISGARCSYWEWAAGEKKDGEWSTVGARAKNVELLEVELGELRVELPVSLVRFHLAPLVEKTIASPAALPEKLKKRLSNAELPLTIAEYGVRSGTSYYAKVQRVTKARPEGKVERTILHLSDRPFVEGRTGHPPTPQALGMSL